MPFLEAPDIPALRLLLLLLPLAAVWLVLRRLGRGLERRLPLAALRAAVQLSLVGYVLVPLFGLEQGGWVLLVLAGICALASFFSLGLLGREPGLRLWPVAVVAILPVVVGLTLFALGGVVPAVGVLDARFAISLCGMLAGNAMNSVSLAGQRYLSGLRDRRVEVEALLGLGASGPEASQGVVSEAVRAAVTPSLNALVAVGLVSLPGMMTGQILGGQDPLVAARWQMMIMALWAAAATLSPALFLSLLGRLMLAGGRLEPAEGCRRGRRFRTGQALPPPPGPPVVHERRPEEPC